MVKNREVDTLESKIKGSWTITNYEVPKKYIRKSGYVNILLFGDIHYGSQFCDHKLAKETLDESAERGDLIIGMGDMLECATRDSVGAGVYKQDDIIQGQLETMMEWLEPHKDRVIGLLTGNHEDRVFKSTGLDLMKTMCKMMKVPYLGAGRLIRIRAGKQTYSIYVTHGSSGATLPYTKIKGVLKLQQYIDADVYAMGHVHALDSHNRAVHRIDLRSRAAIEEDKLFVLTGHYLNYFGSYAHKKGMIPSKKGSPVLKLHTKKRSMRVSI